MTSSRRHHLKVTFNNQDSNVAVCLSDVKTGIYLLCVTVMIESLCSRPAEFDAADRCQLDRAGNRRNRSRQRSSPGGDMPRPRPERRPGGSDGKNTTNQTSLWVRRTRGTRAHVSFHVDRTSARSCTSPSTRSTRTDTTPRPKWRRQTKRYRHAVMWRCEVASVVQTN